MTRENNHIMPFNRHKSSLILHSFNYFCTEKLWDNLHVLHSVISVNRIAKGLVL